MMHRITHPCRKSQLDKQHAKIGWLSNYIVNRKNDNNKLLKKDQNLLKAQKLDSLYQNLPHFFQSGGIIRSMESLEEYMIPANQYSTKKPCSSKSRKQRREQNPQYYDFDKNIQQVKRWCEEFEDKYLRQLSYLQDQYPKLSLQESHKLKEIETNLLDSAAEINSENVKFLEAYEDLKKISKIPKSKLPSQQTRSTEKRIYERNEHQKQKNNLFGDTVPHKKTANQSNGISNPQPSRKVGEEQIFQQFDWSF